MITGSHTASHVVAVEASDGTTGSVGVGAHAHSNTITLDMVSGLTYHLKMRYKPGAFRRHRSQ
jgi:hypothetical protein